MFWVLKDVVQPEAVLVSPYPLLSFHVSPSSPNLVLGGCTNGRIVIWDQSAAQVAILAGCMHSLVAPLSRLKLQVALACSKMGQTSLRPTHASQIWKPPTELAW